MEEKAAGAIWKKVSHKNGKEYLSIKIGDVQYVAFLNDKGGNPARPDYNIFASKPREQTEPSDREIRF